LHQCRAIRFLSPFTPSGSCPTLAPGSGNSFSIAIYTIWELPDPGARVGQFIFHCHLQHLGVARPWYHGSGNSFSIATCSIWELFVPGARVGQFIFYCNLQHLGVDRPWRRGRAICFLLHLQHLAVAQPWRQGQEIYFLLQCTASGSCPTLAPGSGDSFSIAVYNIWELPDPGTRVGQLIVHVNLQLGVAGPWRQGPGNRFLLQFSASGSCLTLVPASGTSFSIAIYSIWELPNPGIRIVQSSFCCNLQHLGVA